MGQLHTFHRNTTVLCGVTCNLEPFPCHRVLVWIVMINLGIHMHVTSCHIHWLNTEQTTTTTAKKNQIILKRHNLLSLAWLRYFVVAPINMAAMGTIHTPNLIMNRLVVLVSAIPVRFDKCLKRLCDAKCNEIASAGFMTKKYERINRRI